ncbi:MAG: acyl-CoA thioesterase [Rubrivivax sp.]|nr:MAG: acyl-CoA thioesterase [Rubrivivax sp.]
MNTPKTPLAAPPAAAKPTPQTRADYAHLSTITTRWMDNDVYGHVNNVTYYSYFDTAVNRYLIEAGVLDIHEGEVIGLVIETHCNYFAPLSFPKNVEAAIRVAHIGRSSVRYEIGLFEVGQEAAAATGHFVHVYVDRATRRPTALPEAFAQVLRGLQKTA